MPAQSRHQPYAYAAEIWDHTVARVGGTCTVTLSGEIDLSCSDELISLLTSTAQDAGADTTEVDLAGVGFMDSSGIDALIAGYRAAHLAGRRFTVVRPQQNVRRVFEIAGVLAMFSGEDASAPSGEAAVCESGG
jgi:stage II sporulation protein AA (anti-sigma F factor antagonist)